MSSLIKRTFSSFIICLSTLLVSGCGVDYVKKIKDSPHEDYPDYKYGELLENRQICEKTKWGEAEDNRGRKFITYTCYHKPYTDYREIIEKITKDVHQEIKASESDLHEYMQSSDEYKKMEFYGSLLCKKKSYLLKLQDSLKIYEDAKDYSVQYIDYTEFLIREESKSFSLGGSARYLVVNDEQQELPNDYNSYWQNIVNNVPTPSHDIFYTEYLKNLPSRAQKDSYEKYYSECMNKS